MVVRDDSGRAALASVDAYVQAEPHDQPVVFIVDYQDTRKAWGWAKTFDPTCQTHPLYPPAQSLWNETGI